MIPKLCDRINAFLKDKNSDVDLSMKSYKTRLKDVTRQIDNLVSVIAETGSKAVIERLNILEKERILIENQVETLNAKISQATISKETITILFGQAKKLFENGTLESSKKLINLFVEKVIIYKDRIEIKLNILPDDNPRKTAKTDNNPDGFFDFLKHSSIIERL